MDRKVIHLLGFLSRNDDVTGVVGWTVSQNGGSWWSGRYWWSKSMGSSNRKKEEKLNVGTGQWESTWPDDVTHCFTRTQWHGKWKWRLASKTMASSLASSTKWGLVTSLFLFHFLKKSIDLISWKILIIRGINPSDESSETLINAPVGHC
jgi:hypothetical protein